MQTESIYLTSFKAMIKVGDFVVLDTETTGLNQQSEICQLAVIDSSGATLMDTLLKPVRPIPAAASRIHGIYDSDVVNAPTWPQVVEDLKRIVAGRNLVIYNAKYDRNMMHCSGEAWNMPKFEWKKHANFWCAMDAFSEIYGEWNEYYQSYRWQKLTLAASYYSLPVINAHAALGDCLMTLGVVMSMVESKSDSR